VEDIVPAVRRGLLAIGLMLAWLTGAAPGASDSSGGEAVAAQPTSAAGRSEAAARLLAGIEQALDGHFDQSERELGRAVELDPDLPSAQLALRLVREHLAAWRACQAERAAEYAEAVRRVRQSFLAQDHQAELKARKLEAKLREKIEEAVLAFNRADDFDTLELAGAEEAVQRKTDAAARTGEALKLVEEALGLLADDDSEYARTFRTLAEEFRRELGAYRQAWADLRVETRPERHRGAMVLRERADAAGDALGALEGMAAAKPWRVGLAQSRLAKDLVPEGVKLHEEDWYRRVVADAEARGKKAIEQADWYEALYLYSGLEELDPGNEAYRQMTKTVRRHVRVLSLYGGGDAEAATTRPKQDDAPPDEDSPEEPPLVRWQQYVKGVDVNMVRSAIVQVGENYVEAVDYRKAARGALTALKVLAETPQAAASFPQLADAARRKDFVEALDREAENIEARQQVDQLDLQYVLNNVIRAAERTVDIPIAVLAVEFTEGMLEELDKFSSMVWPEEVTDFQKRMTGNFFGVGIQITKEPDEPLRVVTPLPGSPALQAGVKAGDLIIGVDGQDTRKQSLDDLVKAIMGEKGTKVRLTLKRAGVREPIDVDIVRDEIRIRTVKGWRREADGEWDFAIDKEGMIGYVRVTQFTGQTGADIAAILDRMRQEGVRSVVLDMRFNPGGLLDAAVTVADEFLDRGVIVSTKGRNAPLRAKEAAEDGKYLQGDLVVLINQASASAAEIVSGALKDWRRGILVGERTYGKGSVQNVIPIRRRRALLKLTTAYYYLPSGRLLHRADGATDWGVEPDVAVHLTPKQLRRWLEIRRKTDLIQEIDPESLDADLKAQFRVDHQLSTALLLLKLMQLKHAAPAA